MFMAKITAYLEQVPHSVTTIMLIGGVLILLGAAGQLMSNYVLQKQPASAREVLRGVSKILVGVGILFVVLAAWRWWQIA